MITEKQGSPTDGAGDETGRSAIESTPSEDDAKDVENTRDHLDELLEEGLEESFPASDPPSILRGTSGSA